jgi:hypothetical protein
MIKDNFTEEHMQALDMTRELYSLGVIHPEYSIHSRSQYEELWTEGKAGMYFNINNSDQYDMADPKAEVHVNGVFPSNKGTFTSAGTGHNGVLAISTAGLISETYNSSSADLDALIADAETQYIMGKITKKQYVEQLKIWNEEVSKLQKNTPKLMLNARVSRL